MHESGPGWTFCLNCLQGVKITWLWISFKSLKCVITMVVFSCGSRGFGSIPSPLQAFKYYMNVFFSETKLFHSHRIFDKNEIKSAKQTPSLKSLHIVASFPESLGLHLQELHILHIKPPEQDFIVTKFSECKILESLTSLLFYG